MKEIRPLTALRGFGAAWVAAYHFTINAVPAGAGSAAAPVLFPGTFGVDIFFVLSGFVISYVYSDTFKSRLDLRDVKSYFFKRFARIYPAYVFILTIFAAAVFANKLHPGIVPHPDNFPLRTLAAQYFLIQSWGIVDGSGWVLPAWSISAEVFVYLLFPFLTFRLVEKRSPLGVLLLAGACFLYVLAPYDYNYGYPAIIRVVAEFGVGMFLLESLQSRWMQWIGRDVALAITLCLTVIFLLALPLGIPPGLFLVFAALIVGGLATNRGVVASILSREPFQYFGRISYSLYASHMLALLVAGRMARSMANVPDASMAPGIFGLGYLLFAVAGAILTYHLVEQPVRRLLLRGNA